MLADLTIKDFLDRVASGDPIPGGGSVAALNGAIAAALAMMVARLTIGRKEYEMSEEVMLHVQALTSRLQGEFVALIEKDAEAYNAVFACFKMPKHTDEEKKNRSTAIQEATKQAAFVPLEVARKAVEMMSVIADVARLGNRNAVTDACISMMTAQTAVLSALMNVRINLISLKDKELAERLQDEADTIEQLAHQQSKELLNAINQELRL